MFTTHQILKRKLFLKKTDFDESSSLRKFFLDRFTLKNANFCSYAFSQKPTIVLRKGKKTVFLSRFLRRIEFWNQFSTMSQIRIKFFKMQNFLVNFTQLVIFCIRNFTARQILKHPIYHTSGFERKFQQRNRFSRETGSTTSSFLGEFAFKIFFFQNTLLKCQSWGFPLS